MAREFRLHRKAKGRFLNNRMIWTIQSSFGLDRLDQEKENYETGGKLAR